MKKKLVYLISIILIGFTLIIPTSFAIENVQLESEFENEEVEENTKIEDGIYEICSSANESKVISIQNNTYSNSTNICLETNNHLKRQKFYITFDESKKSYIIKSMQGNKAVDIYAGRKENFTNVQLYQYNGTSAQQWEIKKIDDKNYTIFSKNSSKCIDIYGGVIKDGSNIQIYENNGSKAQKFVLKKVEELQCENILDEGYYYISSALSKNKVVSIQNGSYSNLANAYIWDKNDKEYQKFKQ